MLKSINFRVLGSKEWTKRWTNHHQIARHYGGHQVAAKDHQGMRALRKALRVI